MKNYIIKMVKENCRIKEIEKVNEVLELCDFYRYLEKLIENDKKIRFIPVPEEKKNLLWQMCVFFEKTKEQLEYEKEKPDLFKEFINDLEAIIDCYK